MKSNVLFSCSQVRENHLPELNLEIQAGKFLLIHGDPEPTRRALRILGLHEHPENGRIELKNCVDTDPATRANYRNRHWSYLFDTPCLLPSFTVMENVAMPFLKLSQHDASEAGDRSTHFLRFVGLPEEIAGEAAGSLDLLDQYRVALARALINRPSALVVEALSPSMNPAGLEVIGGLLGRVTNELGCAVAAPFSEAFLPAAHFVHDLASGQTTPTSRTTSPSPR